MKGEGGGDAEAVDQVGEDGRVVFWGWGVRVGFMGMGRIEEGWGGEGG